jgi:hypothetical protein
MAQMEQAAQVDLSGGAPPNLSLKDAFSPGFQQPCNFTGALEPAVYSAGVWCQVEPVCRGSDHPPGLIITSHSVPKILAGHSQVL